MEAAVKLGGGYDIYRNHGRPKKGVPDARFLSNDPGHPNVHPGHLEAQMGVSKNRGGPSKSSILIWVFWVVVSKIFFMFTPIWGR